MKTERSGAVWEELGLIPSGANWATRNRPRSSGRPSRRSWRAATWSGKRQAATGKTAAFALPLLQRLAAAGSKRARPTAFVLVPTRELAVQVAQALYRYGRRLGAAGVA